MYEANLARFQRDCGVEALQDATPLVIQRHLTRLREAGLRPVSVHQHFVCLRAFLSWCVESGLLADHPMRGMKMRVPRTLPRVPEDVEVQRLLGVCQETVEGKRNAALVALLADSGLRISEALRLRVEDVRFAERTVQVRGGKGGKDGVGHFGAEAAHRLRVYLQARPQTRPEDFLFTLDGERPLRRDYACHLLHKLSRRAGLARKVGPHALRHYAATSLLRQTGDLELVRQVLRHETLHMALKYAHLARPDVARKFRRASPLDNLRAGR
jgi:site-specific recombinase XerD